VKSPRAAPGDSVLLYAIGCGATNPVFPAGVVVAETTVQTALRSRRYAASGF
jgi:uncharacterized protein (TIGR03437 family)